MRNWGGEVRGIAMVANTVKALTVGNMKGTHRHRSEGNIKTNLRISSVPERLCDLSAQWRSLDVRGDGPLRRTHLPFVMLVSSGRYVVTAFTDCLCVREKCQHNTLLFGFKKGNCWLFGYYTDLGAFSPARVFVHLFVEV